MIEAKGATCNSAVRDLWGSCAIRFHRVRTEEPARFALYQVGPPKILVKKLN